MRVFIADRSEALRQRLATMLSELKGVEVVGQASDQPAILDFIRRQQPDVAVLDIGTLGNDAHLTVQSLMLENSSVKIITLTTYPCPAYQKLFDEAGLGLLYCKSKDLSDVLKAVESLARKT